MSVHANMNAAQARVGAGRRQSVRDVTRVARMGWVCMAADIAAWVAGANPVPPRLAWQTAAATRRRGAAWRARFAQGQGLTRRVTSVDVARQGVGGFGTGGPSSPALPGGLPRWSFPGGEGSPCSHWIPACAGMTKDKVIPALHCASSPRSTARHPRAGGDPSVRSTSSGGPCSSSPRRRGSKRALHQLRWPLLVIPAQAGIQCPGWPASLL